MFLQSSALNLLMNFLSYDKFMSVLYVYATFERVINLASLQVVYIVIVYLRRGVFLYLVDTGCNILGCDAVGTIGEPRE